MGPAGLGRLAVLFALSGPVSAVGSEQQEGGEKGDGEPALGAEHGGDAADEGEGGDHRPLP